MSTREPLEKVYDPGAVEPEVYQSWERSDAFRSVPDGRPHEQTFTIVIPPPNVTGALHLGHALNNTLQDILVRYHRMRGFNTLWQPGTDHAGIATQAVVERRIREQEGKSRHELGREELVRRIWQWKDEYEKRIISQLKLMGCSCDWGRTRFTLDEGLARAVRHMFFMLFRDGLIFRGKRLVNWDTQLQTAVSDDEVYYETVKGHFWHIKYPVIPSEPPTSVGADVRSSHETTKARSHEARSLPEQGGTSGGCDEPEFVIIATTRPETMLGDTAVAVHPDPEAFFDRREAELKGALERLTGQASKEAAEFRAKLDALAARRESHLPTLIKLRDLARAGRKLRLPLVDRVIPLILDEWADPTLGTGCVKITPAHDPNDYEVGLRHSLPMINVLTADGKIAPIIEPDPSAAPCTPGTSENVNSERYAGLTFSVEGRDKVVADLEARGLIDHVEDRDIELGHSDRSKLPIEPYLSDQWFVRTGEPPTSVGADLRMRQDARYAQRAADFSRRGHADAISRRSPDLGAGAALITWTTYGTWLPGDQRGFVSRVPSPESPHPVHNLPGEQYDADDPQALASALDRLEGTPVYLDPDQATTALAAIARVCGHHGIEPLAVAVMANHVHILCQTERPKDTLLKLFKGGVSHAFGKLALKDAPRWFTKGGSVRYSKTRGDVTAAMEYVKKQNQPLASWSFDIGGAEFDSAFQAGLAEPRKVAENRESAPTEVGGSLGLAQSAMDAVTDGRIRVFPERYAKSYLDWLGEKRDWCISRQLWWGHRIPVWSIEFNPGAWESTRDSLLDLDNEVVSEGIQLLVGLFSSLGSESKVVIRPRRSTVIEVCALSAAQDKVLHALKGYREATDSEFEDAGRAFTDLGIPAPWGLRTRIARIERDPDVLDTWFSSALWPFSTLGWPEETPHLKQYYPGSVLCTSRDIITNWVARMVMFGLYAMHEVPFDHVYIHPKILDGRGETMSKSKGNGVDPVDIIHTHGADAMRYTLADMTTETQDIRMPVEYVCPHCGGLTDQGAALKAEEQNRKSRGQKLDRKLQPADCHRVKCAHCGKSFATQWADAATKQELQLARETSDKFEIGRNFCNKLWNAARFAFMNLEEGTEGQRDEGTKGNRAATVRERLLQETGDPVGRAVPAIGELQPEDRWILARLSQTIRRYHELIANYQFSASVRELRDFFWDSLCDWYLELTKPRLSDERRDRGIAGSGDRETARQVLAFCMDQVLRLWHPTIPFITERLWRQLNDIAPRRGIPGAVDLQADSLLIHAEFPPLVGYPQFDDPEVLATFAALQDATRGVRELRNSANVPPKEKVAVTVIVPPERLDSFRREAHIVRHMANIGELHTAASGKRPANAASITIGAVRIFVHDISDDQAERVRSAKALEGVLRQIAACEAKLSNEKFVANARPEVVEAEQRRLRELVTNRDTLQAHLAELCE